ncbi:MAG: hypothetical protein LBG59_01300 [Candidatus Peribacteria bacterium]|jgi:microcystin-dependent protein|nr:hypothetical protein [Candidatus Peribacteria bacterium]
MAFDLSTCPSGWTRFSAADNRFIMGASTNSKATGGSASITLSASQLPSHKHYLFVPSFLENKGRDHSSPQSTRSAIDDHKHSAGDNNYSMTV